MNYGAHKMAKFLILTVVGLVFVGILACGMLGASAMAFRAGQSHGYPMGVTQGSGEGVAPVPYGYHRPGLGFPCFTPLLCCGGLLLVLGVLLLFGMAAIGAGKRHRPWRGPFGPGGKLPEDMPDAVREYMEQRFKGGHFCPPDPWMFRHGPWTRGHGPRGYWHGSWTDEDMPDEVKQWFRQYHGRRSEGPQEPESPVEDAPSEDE